MPRLLAIDPGSTESGYVVYDVEQDRFIDHGKIVNQAMLELIATNRLKSESVAIEMIASYGMPVGAEVFNTCVWIGHFSQVFISNWKKYGGGLRYIYRREVKLTLCGSPRAKDSNVRQAIIDRYPQTGGGKTPQVGTKKQPGPLYGFKADIWQAAGVALTWKELQKNESTNLPR